MTISGRHRLGGLLVALSLGLGSVGSVQAQQGPPSGGPGFVMGEVDKCVNGNETPVSGVTVGIAGGDATMAKTDQMGDFVLALSPGQYTVQATADDGTSASRPYVPVDANGSLDIGVLELAGGCAGNDIQAMITQAPTVPPTAQPTAAATATPAPPSPTPAPTQPAATATPAPATDQSTPDQTAPSDDQSPDTSSDGG
jgi:hypothetical protein